MPTLEIADLRGGLNDADPPLSIPADQVVEMRNIDLTRSTCGARRLGHASISVPGSALSRLVHIARHLSTQDETQAQIWLVSTDNSTSSNFIYGDYAGSFAGHDETPTGNEALDVAAGQYAIRSVSAHGKLFFAYPTDGDTDRLHVWDGTSIRKTGLAEPAAPTAAETAAAGTYATTRYFRQRYTEQVGGVTVRRSEPSDPVEITPSGTKTGVTVTKSAAISEGETHWELEESVDGTNYYRIATTAVGTTTYTDTLTAAAVTADETLLSEDIGDYTLQHNPKFLSLDQDRLLLAGAWENAAYASRIAWTPVYAADGVGNDERLEEDVDPFVDLDGYDGGELTDFAGPMFGYHLAYKRKRIYKLLRSRARVKAYEVVPYVDTIGALTGSVVKGIDEQGQPCQYFLDADYGPMRVGVRGIERLGADIHTTWQRVNLDASLVCVGYFNPDTNIVGWYIAVDSDTTPTLRIRADVTQFRPGVDGARRGWMVDDGPYMAALCCAALPDNWSSVSGSVAQHRHLKPYVGTAISGSVFVECETGSSDNGTPYRSYLKTKPNLLGGLMQKGAVKSAVLTAAAAETDVRVTLVRDYGKERRDFTASLRPTPANEDHVMVPLDSCEMAEVRALQVEMGDAAPAAADWTLDALALRIEPEEHL